MDELIAAFIFAGLGVVNFIFAFAHPSLVFRLFGIVNVAICTAMITYLVSKP